jgi:hypothetical protein
VKKEFLEALITFLSQDPLPDSNVWQETRKFLIEELIKMRREPYQSTIHYKLQRYDSINGATISVSLGRHSTNIKAVRATIRKELKNYTLKELRLYHGAHRIHDIKAFLEDEVM